ncbi:GMC family oxidoreductase N-terminal domain-containing protein [Polaromonas sp.]|uniref:GMC family oxidoreductase n=1 Tax=Polaromonas sp. TaxID=1869339 RepID=UPI0017EE4483|nr:GMC family oxidoreductase N-terminal domain-containing protein [Polaromonas sp.]NMM06760.1 choline dehydrogenase [Polaromonas sp.]
MDTFDYVIVGAGAAGSLLAARLSENSNARVCLLEAGPPDVHPLLHLPAGFIKMLENEKYTWQFEAEPAAQTNGRAILLPQGRTLGGSTAINGMVYNRGQREDYDDWEALGNPGWNFDSVLPHFRRSEAFLGDGDDQFRGRDGELFVTTNDWIHPLTEAFLQGAGELGIHGNRDYNGASQAGAGYYQRMIHRGRRVSASRAFLRPAVSRRNLDIRTNAQVTRILSEGGTATGVEYLHGDRAPTTTVRARKEVIVCAGAINTPKLLQLSGFGPAELLRDLGIPVVRDLPGVGANLRDHFAVRVVAKARNVTTINELARPPRLWWEAVKWALGRPSVLAVCPSIVHFHWRSDGTCGRPDLQGVFSPASYRAGKVGMLDRYPGMSCGFWLHRPASSGSVSLRSIDPLQSPKVEAGYLTHAADCEGMLRGLRLARRLLATRALAPYFEAETLPGSLVQSDDELLDYIRQVGASSYHLNGTARMGPASDRFAVVDASLRVHGVGALRIADASVFPAIPSANICAATFMVAEKAASLVLSESA